jgi:hypothetical protein
MRVRSSSFTFTPASQIASVTRTNDAYAWTAHFNVSRPYSVNGITVTRALTPKLIIQVFEMIAAFHR